MSHDIEAATHNVEKAHSIVLQANQKLQKLDADIQYNVTNFMEAFKRKLLENRKKKINVKTGMDDIFKLHNKAVEIQKEKIDVCKKAYDDVDEQVNQFDVKLQNYYDNKEKAKISEYSMARIAAMQRRRKRKKRRNPNGTQRASKVRESVEVEVPAAEFIADPSEPRYCYCQRVAFGRMVACDGKECQYEWFHFICVGLSEDPTSDWYCEECKSKMEAAAAVSIKRKSVSKTPKRHVESYLSPIKKKINPRKSLSELKRENVEQPLLQLESFSPEKEEPKTPKRSSPKKIATPKSTLKSIRKQTPKKVMAEKSPTKQATPKKTSVEKKSPVKSNKNESPKKMKAEPASSKSITTPKKISVKKSPVKSVKEEETPKNTAVKTSPLKSIRKQTPKKITVRKSPLKVVNERTPKKITVEISPSKSAKENTVKNSPPKSINKRTPRKVSVIKKSPLKSSRKEPTKTTVAETLKFPKQSSASELKSSKSVSKRNASSTTTTSARRQLFDDESTSKRKSIQCKIPETVPIKVSLKPIKLPITLRSSTTLKSSNAVTPKTPSPRKTPNLRSQSSATVSLRRRSQR